MPEPISNRDLAAMETVLKALVPSPGQLQRDSLLYRAGQLSVAKHPWLWQATTLGFAAMSVAIGVGLIIRPVPEPLERIVYVTIEKPVQSASVLEMNLPNPSRTGAMDDLGFQPGKPNLIALEQQILRWGLDALPNPPTPVITADPPLTLENVLGISPGEKSAISSNPFSLFGVKE